VDRLECNNIELSKDLNLRVVVDHEVAYLSHDAHEAPLKEWTAFEMASVALPLPGVFLQTGAFARCSSAPFTQSLWIGSSVVLAAMVAIFSLSRGIVARCRVHIHKPLTGFPDEFSHKRYRPAGLQDKTVHPNVAASKQNVALSKQVRCVL
jgi:hypothetical protein